MAVDAEGLVLRVKDYARSLYSTRRLSLFLSAGALGALFETGALFGLVEFGGLQPVLGGAVAKEMAIVAMFVFNDRVTFASNREPGLARAARRLVKSNLTRSFGVAVSLAVLALLYQVFGVMYLAANGVGILAGFTVNYAAESLVTWRVHHE